MANRARCGRDPRGPAREWISEGKASATTTPSLPWNDLGNWSQSTATLLPSFRGFPGGAICYRLPPVASPGLHKSGVVGHEHRLEPRSSPGGDHARAGADEDPRMRFDPLDEVVGHRLGERVAAHDDRHPLGELGQVERGLAGRVDAADDDHLAVAVERRLARRGAIEDAGADQALDPLRLEPPVVDAR